MEIQSTVHLSKVYIVTVFLKRAKIYDLRIDSRVFVYTARLKSVKAL